MKKLENQASERLEIDRMILDTILPEDERKQWDDKMANKNGSLIVLPHAYTGKTKERQGGKVKEKKA